MKRVFDIGMSAVGLLFLSPVLAIVAGLVRWRMGSPILFRQQRPGIHGVPFTLIKFRTMNDLRSVEGVPLSDKQRMSNFGGSLRSTSLDELPELWNVLKGEMSIVGPRPLLMGYLPVYSLGQARRHEVKPGLTGLAQVLGRNDTTWGRRLELDVWYVDHWTIWLDLRILAMTVGRVLGGRGVSAKGHATMPPFQGPASA